MVDRYWFPQPALPSSVGSTRGPEMKYFLMESTLFVAPWYISLISIFYQHEGWVNGLLGNWKMSLKRIENTQKGEGRETQMLKSSKRCWESKDNYVYLLINCLPPKEKRRCWKKGCAEKCDYYFIRRFQKVFKSKGSFWKGNRGKYKRGDRRRIDKKRGRW